MPSIEQMKDVYIVQCLMETDLYKLLKTQVSIRFPRARTQDVSDSDRGNLCERNLSHAEAFIDFRENLSLLLIIHDRKRHQTMTNLTT